MWWCDTCEERKDHQGVCGVCGDIVGQNASPLPPQNLQTRQSSGPSRTDASRNEMADILRASAEEGFILENSVQEVDNNRSVRNLIDTLTIINQSFQIIGNDSLGQAVGTASAAGDIIEDAVWEQPPDQIMDPGQSASRSIPASREYIRNIPRIVLDERSPLLALYRTTVRCIPPFPVAQASNGPYDTRYGEATAGEFGKKPPYSVTGRLTVTDIVGGQITNFRDLDRNITYGVSKSTKSWGSTVAYFDRGGSTFVGKAIAAQKAGASAVVIGNNGSVWPFIMKDSTGHAERSGLNIPVVMVKQSDTKWMKEMVRDHEGSTVSCTVACELACNDGEENFSCVVCQERFKVGDVVITLPDCRHTFHENCVMTWLEKHNTCPFCRKELPTDDPEYEQRKLVDGRIRLSHTLDRRHDDYDMLLG